MPDYPTPPFPEEKQPGPEPGDEHKMKEKPDFGQDTYVGHDKLKGKVALITGADSGIGRAIAVAFAREGADVAIGYWKEHEDAKETLRWVEKAGRKGVLIEGDLAEPGTADKYFASAVKELGGQISILVNNAAIQEDNLDSFLDIKPERLEHTFRVNYFAYFRLAQLAVRHFLDNDIEGNIINVGSIQAYMPTPGILDYATTKTTKFGSSESSVGVPMERPGQPAEYQGPAVFLASDASSYCTGSILNVTGGMIIG